VLIVIVARLQTWKGFRTRVADALLQVSPLQRKLFWFRGQGDADWALLTSLDRARAFSSDLERLTYYDRLLEAFRQEMIGLSSFKDLEGEPLELLARHHGLPSTLLDWTESPYIAAFFAFLDSLGKTGGRVSVFVLNQARLPANNDFNVINDRELLRYNERALEQRGVFLRVNSFRLATESLLGESLTKFTVPQSECVAALGDLASMGITVRNLFRDLDGAAKSARTQVELARLGEDDHEHTTR
jgi:hypothetical protein